MATRLPTRPRERVASTIARDLRQVDLLIYSLAAPVRRHPETGEQFRSTIKPLGEPLAIKTLDVSKGISKGEVRRIVLDPATEEEAAATVRVMGGEDWELWVDALQRENVLADGFQTVAYSYLGSDLTARIYREGTLGLAKADIDRAARALNKKLATVDGRAPRGGARRHRQSSQHCHPRSAALHFLAVPGNARTRRP